MSFASDLNRFANKSGEQIEQARRKTVLDLFSAVIKDTPVKTGRAKGNWQTSVGTVKAAVLDRTGESAAQDELLAALGQWHDDETIYIANGLPYIERLEDGSSKQAPAGMVRRNVTRFDTLLNAAARQANK